MFIDNVTRWEINKLLAGSTVGNTTLIAKALGLDINKTRRILDTLVSEGVLAKEQSEFWNGMHYATRNYYWRKAAAKGK